MTVPVRWREPFSMARPYMAEQPHGSTIAELVATVPNLPAGFADRGMVHINGESVPRHMWSYVRPKANTHSLPIVVTLHYSLEGGGSSGSSVFKSIIAIVAVIALTALTAGIGAGALGIGGFFGSGLGAHLLAGAVSVIGALAISALTAPPKAAAQNASTGQDLPAASLSGNVIQAGGAIPRVLGTRRLFPPLVGDPIVEIIDNDQYVEACFALNGPHLLDDVRLGDAALTSAQDVESELRAGWPDDTAVTLTARQGKQLSLNVEMSSHVVDPSNQQNLKDPSTPSVDLPLFHPFGSRKAPDEVWLQFDMPAGLAKQTDTTVAYSIPFRIRARPRGTSNWINFPEIHLSDHTNSHLRKAFIFKWAATPAVSAVPSSNGFVLAHINVPGQVTAPATSGWQAAPFFDDGAGNSYLIAGGEATTRIRNTLLFDNRVEFYLDEVTFPKGYYDFEIKRGSAYDDANFTKTSYQYSGNVRDFFTYFGTGTPQIPVSRDGISDTVVMSLAQSIWNDHPVAKSGLALIAIRAKNRRVDALSVLASGYVRDWDGSGWNTWTTTRFPAAHFVDVLSGLLNRDPLPSDLRDDAGLAGWRTKCQVNKWTADIVVEDMRTFDVLTLLASCGYARPYQSELYGVAVDDDHSADDIVQVFSPRNSTNFRYEKSFARLPNGFLITFPDSTQDYQQAQTVVYADGYSAGTAGRLESVSYDGMVETNKVETRGKFDLDQAMLRSTFYYLDADMESIVCRKGDLVAVQHDAIDQRAGFALVQSKALSADGTLLTGFTLDSTIPITNEADMHAVTDMHGVPDMHDVGISTGISIRRNDGSVSTHAVGNASGSWSAIVLSTPMSDFATIDALADTGEQIGSMIVSGILTSQYTRLLVASIAPGKEGSATLTFVDEATSLNRIAAEPVDNPPFVGADQIVYSRQQPWFAQPPPGPFIGNQQPYQGRN